MTDDEKDAQRGFKVQDRRRFTDPGEGGDDRAAPSHESGPASPSSAAATATAAESAEIEMNFSTFVISLSTQVLAHLGEIPSPIDNVTSTDLLAARQMIDILGMLREKTKGNLDKSEQALLDNILYDLRMRYVETSHRR
jgi:hypothetical protein